MNSLDWWLAKVDFRQSRILDLLGWGLVILFLPISYHIGDFSITLAYFIVPIALYLGMTFGVTGVFLVAVAGLSMLAGYIFPIDLGEFGFGPRLWLFSAAVFCAYLAATKLKLACTISKMAGWQLALILFLLPFSFSLDHTFNPWGIFDDLGATFQWGLSSLVTLSAALFALANFTRRKALLVVLPASLFGIFGTTFLEVMEDNWVFAEYLQLEFETARFWYSFNSLGNLISYALVYEISRYLFSFHRASAWALPGRCLPGAWQSISTIALLTLITQVDLIHSIGLYDAPKAINLYLSTFLLFLSWVLAGFWLRIWGGVLSAIAIVIVALLRVNFEYFTLEFSFVILPFLFGYFGQYWRSVVRGDPILLIDRLWLSVGFTLGAVFFSLPLAIFGDVNPALSAVMWFGVITLLIWFFGSNGFLARHPVMVPARLLGVLEILVLIGLVYTFVETLVPAIAFPFATSSEVLEAFAGGFGPAESRIFLISTTGSVIFALFKSIQGIPVLFEGIRLLKRKNKRELLSALKEVGTAFGMDFDTKRPILASMATRQGGILVVCFAAAVILVEIMLFLVEVRGSAI